MKTIDDSTQHEAIWAEIRRRFHQSDFNYTSFRDCTLKHFVEVDFSGWVAAIGDGANGDYEWIVQYGGKFAHSNAGYGCPASALRDGLIEALG